LLSGNALPAGQHLVAKKCSMFRRLTVLFILLLLLSTFAAALHHHDNAAEIHDCPICLVSHHQYAAGLSTAALDDAPFITETIYAVPAQVLAEQLFISLLSNRAPPA
jgi:hypothetical protein